MMIKFGTLLQNLSPASSPLSTVGLKKLQRGFTLLELSFVVGLVSILVGGFTVYQNTSNAKATKLYTDVMTVKDSVLRYASDTGMYPSLLFLNRSPSSLLSGPHGAQLTSLQNMSPHLDTWGGPYLQSVPLATVAPTPVPGAIPLEFQMIMHPKVDAAIRTALRSNDDSGFDRWILGVTDLYIQTTNVQKDVAYKFMTKCDPQWIEGAPNNISTCAIRPVVEQILVIPGNFFNPPVYNYVPNGLYTLYVPVNAQLPAALGG